MNLTQEYVTDLRMAAHACDDLSTHYDELAYAEKLQRILDKRTGRMIQNPIHFPVEKRKWFKNSYSATSVEDAVEHLSRVMGVN